MDVMKVGEKREQINNKLNNKNLQRFTRQNLQERGHPFSVEWQDWHWNLR